MIDIQKIRQDFPILQDGIGKKSIVYFDTACQSLRPKPVIEAINQYYLQESACSGRSMHQLAAAVTRNVDQSRNNLAKFFNAAKKEEIVFTRNTTEGINLVSNSIGLKAGDVVIISDKEHNSNLIPWQMLSKKQGVVVKVISFSPR